MFIQTFFKRRFPVPKIPQLLKRFQDFFALANDTSYTHTKVMFTDWDKYLNMVMFDCPNKGPRDLKEILIQITATNDLSSVNELVLRISSDNVPIYQLSWYIPVLQKLVLDGSNLRSLRELGDGLHQLELLSLRNCSLKSLDGLLSFHNIKILDVSSNYIKHLSYVGSLNQLAHLNLTKNHIKNFKLLTFLKKCDALKVLHMLQNPCCECIEYRMKLIGMLPQIELLDGSPTSDLKYVALVAEKQRDDIGCDQLSLSTNGRIIIGNLATAISRKDKQKKGTYLNDNTVALLNTFENTTDHGKVSTKLLNAAIKWKEEITKVNE